MKTSINRAIKLLAEVQKNQSARTLTESDLREFAAYVQRVKKQFVKEGLDVIRVDFEPWAVCNSYKYAAMGTTLSWHRETGFSVYRDRVQNRSHGYKPKTHYISAFGPDNVKIEGFRRYIKGNDECPHIFHQ